MGVKGSKNQKKIIKGSVENLINAELSPSLFDFKYIIGKGGFGRVWKVVLKNTNTYFAMKEMSKLKILDKKSEKLVKNERDLLSKINHPFIVNMYSAFQTEEYLYLVMDLLSGGDLRFHVSHMERFTEEQSKFFICCVILGLEYLHVNNVIHRDIKPENLVLDENGYIRITDFGIARVYKKENGNETSGTPGYISPEVLKGINHTPAVDYFALGVLTYELMMGIRPYSGKNKRDLKEKILTKQVKLTKKDIPSGWNIEVGDFINRLLLKQPANRLGLRGATEIKNHPWLKQFLWKDLYYKNLKAPFIPQGSNNYDKKYCESTDKIGNETKIRYQQIGLALQNFDDFTYLKLEQNLYSLNEIGVKSINKEFYNPHPYLFEIKDEEEKLRKQMIDNEKIKKPKSNALKLESNFVKKKYQAFSLSNLTLMKEYKMINNMSNNSSYSIQFQLNEKDSQKFD